MKELLQALASLQHSPLKATVDQRIQEFKAINKESSDELFKELCFCIMTANFSAERGIKIHRKLCDYFSSSTVKDLENQLRQHGYRFPNRASHIVTAATLKQDILTRIQTLKGNELRQWLVDTIPGLGFKEASHFLRNIGYEKYAIIDSHILDLLDKHHIIKQPTSLTKKKYVEIEQILCGIAQQVGLTLAELDLYLWYMETGKILK